MCSRLRVSVPAGDRQTVAVSGLMTRLSSIVRFTVSDPLDVALAEIIAR